MPDNVVQLAPELNLTGRMVMLDLTRCRRFNCGGFSLGFNNPVGLVPENASMTHIRQALNDGRLLDVTGQSLEGLKAGGSQHSPVEHEDTGKRIFMATDKAGNLFMVTPKDAEEAKRFDAEIAETGTLNLQFERSVEVTAPAVLPERSRIIITDPEDST